MTHVFIGWFMIIFSSFSDVWVEIELWDEGEKNWLSKGIMPKYHRPLKIQIYLVRSGKTKQNKTLTRLWTFSLDEPSTEKPGCFPKFGWNLEDIRACEWCWKIHEKVILTGNLSSIPFFWLKDHTKRLKCRLLAKVSSRSLRRKMCV